MSFYTYFQLSWTPLSTDTNSIIYEVAISPTADMCTTDTSSAFIGQYISYINTTDTSVNITCLEPNTCYILGIRAVSQYSDGIGKWVLLTNTTLALGRVKLMLLHDYNNLPNR